MNPIRVAKVVARGTGKGLLAPFGKVVEIKRDHDAGNHYRAYVARITKEKEEVK